MIPNKLIFSLDLQDLPARATQVSSEALSLSGKGFSVVYSSVINPAQGHPPYWTGNFSQAEARQWCDIYCGGYAPDVRKITANTRHAPVLGLYNYEH